MMSMESAGVLRSVLSGANASALPFLESLEGDLKPNAVRRLALIGGTELQEQLRLSNSVARQLKKIRGLAQNSELPQEHGFLLGEEGGWDSWLVRCALLGATPSEEDRKTVTDSSSQIMPVKSADLVDWFEGQELGVALRKAQDFWVSSNMKLTKAALIAHLLKEKQ
jgi:poly(A) polymerase